MELTFEKAAAAQRERLEHLLRAAFAPYASKLGRELAAESYAWLDAAMARGDVYAASDATQIIGVVATTRRGDELYIDQIAVDPALQRAGTGGWLLRRIEDIARSDGVRRLSLDTAEMMEGLIRLYQRHGFHIVRRTLPAHGKDAHLRVHMVKEL